MKIIESNNIFSEKVNLHLNDLIKSSEKLIYISPVHSIYNERVKTNPAFSELKNQDNIFPSKDKFEKYIFNIVTSKKGYLPTVDMYFIFKKLIEDYFSFNSKLLNAYKTVCYQLFDFYKLLIFHDINEINSKDLRYIRDNYPVHCFLIFDLFNYFQKILDDIKRYVDFSTEDSTIFKMKKPEIVLSVAKNKNQNFDNFINKQKQEINSVISSVDVIYFDGFISFTDLDKYIINQAKKLKKKSFLSLKIYKPILIKNF